MKLKSSFLFLFLFLFSQSFALEVKREFISDNCTFLPITNPAVERCCFKHDLYYWAGGNGENRKNVDHNFKTCIQQEDKAILAAIMYAGVRLGSYSPWKFPGKQWGNAWSDIIRKTSLNSKEINQIKESLVKQGLLSQNEINIFIKELKKNLPSLSNDFSD